jgi:hypothetical protein
MRFCSRLVQEPGAKQHAKGSALTTHTTQRLHTTTGSVTVTYHNKPTDVLVAVLKCMSKWLHRCTL